MFKSKIFNALAFLAIAAAFLAFTNIDSTLGDPWDIPAKYQKMQPPADLDDDDGIGKDLFREHCASCHGKKGRGDGSKAAELEHEMLDFTTDEYKSQSWGVKYYKSIIGREETEMPNFEKKIRSEEDRWLVVKYMETL